jgi:hypothetical protein
MRSGLWRATGLAAAKTPATLSRQKQEVGWFRGGGVPWLYTKQTTTKITLANFKVRRDKLWRPTKHPLSLGKYHKPELRQRGGIGKTANK